MSDWVLSLTQQSVQHLGHLQNHAVRLLYHLHKFDHGTEYYRQVEWLPLPKLITFHSLSVMFHH